MKRLIYVAFNVKMLKKKTWKLKRVREGSWKFLTKHTLIKKIHTIQSNLT